MISDVTLILAHPFFNAANDVELSFAVGHEGNHAVSSGDVRALDAHQSERCSV